MIPRLVAFIDKPQ